MAWEETSQKAEVIFLEGILEEEGMSLVGILEVGT